MPVEIRELVIKATVSDPNAAEAPSSLYRAAMSSYHQRFYTQAIDLWKKLVTQYPAAKDAALARSPARQTFIIADNHPVRWRELFSHIASLVGGAAPTPGGRAGFPSFRVRNDRARELLNWSPFYSDYRAGLAR